MPRGNSKEGGDPASASVNPYIPKYMATVPWYAEQGSVGFVEESLCLARPASSSTSSRS